MIPRDAVFSLQPKIARIPPKLMEARPRIVQSVKESIRAFGGTTTALPPPLTLFSIDRLPGVFDKRCPSGDIVWVCPCFLATPVPAAPTGFRWVDPGGTTTGPLPPAPHQQVSAGLIPAGPQLVRYHQRRTNRFPRVYPGGTTTGPLPPAPHQQVSVGFIPAGPQLVRYPSLPLCNHEDTTSRAIIGMWSTTGLSKERAIFGASGRASALTCPIETYRVCRASADQLSSHRADSVETIHACRCACFQNAWLMPGMAI